MSILSVAGAMLRSRSIDLIRLSEALHGHRPEERPVVEVSPRLGPYVPGHYVVSIADIEAIREINARVDRRHEGGRCPHELAEAHDWYPARAAKSLIQVGLIESYGGAYNLVSAPNQVHADRRALAAPFFNPTNKSRFDRICEQSAEVWAGDLRPGPMEAFDALCRVAAQMSVEAFVGVPLAESDAREVIRAFQIYVPCFLALSWTTLLGVNAESIPIAPHREAFKELRTQAERLVQRRLALLDEPTGPAKDYVGALLEQTRDRTGGPLSMQDVVDEVMVILFAGHDTTASWLNSALAVLGTEELQSVQDTIRSELKSDNGERRPVLEDFLQEVGRLYPPVPSTVRQLLVETELTIGGKDYVFPADTLVLLDVFSAHRSTKVYGADVRCARLDRKGAHPPSFFSDPGHRTCIGNVFAQHQAVATLRSLLTRYRVRLSRPEVFTTGVGVTRVNNDPDGLWLDLEPIR